MRFSSLLVASALGCIASTAAGSSKKVPKGFVTTSGTDFVLDGKKFAFLGANSYWIPLLNTKEDVDTTLKGMRDHGVKVLRTWGFNAINSTDLESVTATNLTYYQVWYPNGTYTLNTGPQGLQRLDYVVEAAGKYNIKLILPFTNDWIGYGGMDLYLRNIIGAGVTQDKFYTDAKVKKAFKAYIKTIVNRYKNSPNVFLPSGPACVPGSNTLYNWYKETSDYVRSLDPYHMITTGGEGAFFWKKPEHYWYNGTYVSDYNYNGQAGEDFDKDLTLPNINFGVYHMYPLSWYPSLIYPGSNFSVKAWGIKWIQQHADSAKKHNKPVVLEEFGLPIENRTDLYPAWINKALDTRIGGIMPWQYGQLGLTEDGGNRLIKYADAIIDGASPNDGNTYFKNQTDIWNLFQNAGKVFNSRSK